MHATVHGTAVHAVTHANAHAATVHETKHTTIHQYEGTHGHTSARFTPVMRHEHAGVARTTVDRIESESTTRFREMARTATPISHVTLQREAFRTITVHRAPLAHARFVTGTIVSRSSNTIVVRTQTGSTVTVLTQAVPIVSAAIVPGNTIVLPVQFTNGQFMLVPAFTAAEETAAVNEPMLAPCAVNDNDADDAGDTSYYAPPNACLNNDGDADDGMNFALPALPSSFGQLPQFFSSSYAPAVAAGFVVTQMGSNVLLMTPDFKPLVINASPALTSGTTNGQLTPGRYVVAYGFNVNNTLVATTFM
jgi:hypothetical protein